MLLSRKLPYPMKPLNSIGHPHDRTRTRNSCVASIELYIWMIWFQVQVLDLLVSKLSWCMKVSHSIRMNIIEWIFDWKPAVAMNTIKLWVLAHEAAFGNPHISRNLHVLSTINRLKIETRSLLSRMYLQGESQFVYVIWVNNDGFIWQWVNGLKRFFMYFPNLKSGREFRFWRWFNTWQLSQYIETIM